MPAPFLKQRVIKLKGANQRIKIITLIKYKYILYLYLYLLKVLFNHCTYYIITTSAGPLTP
jgi:hypothetical protein